MDIKQVMEANDGLIVVKGRPTQCLSFTTMDFDDIEAHLPAYGANLSEPDEYMRASEWVAFIAEIFNQDPVEIIQDSIDLIFDDSDYEDCGFTAMASHTADMGNLSRMISEQCYKGHKISDPRLNIPTFLKPRSKYKWSPASKRACSYRIDISNPQSYSKAPVNNDGLVYWKRPEWLSKRINCDLLTAQRLIEAWVELDATPQMITEFLRWINDSGKSMGLVLAYFRNLATQLDAVTYTPPVDAIFDPYAETDESVDEPEEEDYWVPSTPFIFPPVGPRDEELEKPWIECQPYWYQNLIRKLNSIRDDKALAALGKEIFERKDDFSRHQMGVFWTCYNIRKKHFESKTRWASDKLLSFVQDTHKETGWLGKYLWNLQNQQGLKLTNSQWSEIWKAWNARKARATTPPTQMSFV